MAHKDSSAKHTFYYLLILVTLGFVATGTGSIFFQLIEYFFPDPSDYVSLSQGALRFGISSLIVGAPIYWFVTRRVYSELFHHDLSGDSLVRKWLTYLILLISSITVIGDLMIVLQDFLSGELTLRFLLKYLVVLVIAGLVFGYYLYDIRREIFTETRALKAFRFAFFTLMVLALIGGFYVMDSPFESRKIREDSQRIQALNSLRYQISEYSQVNDQLPQSLDVIAEQYTSRLVHDPITNERFEYRVMSQQDYQLCATFSTSNREDDTSEAFYPSFPEWYHDAGQECFTLKVDEAGREIFPPMRVRE